MADEWYYIKGGNKLGPVTTSRLRDMATSGQLLLDDLVWKQGLSEWKPARQITGLFGVGAKAAAATQPPPQPAGTSNQKPVAGGNALAKTFVEKTVAAASNLATRIQQASHAHAQPNPPAAPANAQPAPQPIVCPFCRQTLAYDPALAGQLVACPYCNRQFAMLGAAMPTPSPRQSSKSKRIPTLTGGLGCLLLILLCAGLAVIGRQDPVARRVAQVNRDMAERKRRAKNATRPVGETWLDSFDEHPKPVLDAVAQGKEVWLLHDRRGEPDREDLYAVLSGGQLEYVVEKYHHPAGSTGAEMVTSETDYGLAHDVDFWIKRLPGRRQLKGSGLAWEWSGSSDSSAVRLTYETRPKSKSDWVITEQIVVQSGYWESTTLDSMPLSDSEIRKLKSMPLPKSGTIRGNRVTTEKHKSGTADRLLPH